MLSLVVNPGAQEKLIPQRHLQRALPFLRSAVMLVAIASVTWCFALQNRQKQSGDQKNWEWLKDGRVKCSGSNGGCVIHRFAEASELTAWHTKELADATKELNAIADRVREGNRDKSREARVILFPGHAFLAWVSGEGESRSGHSMNMGRVSPKQDLKAVARDMHIALAVQWPWEGWHWTMNGNMQCYTWGYSQVVEEFAQTDRPISAHDEVLMKATDDMNRIVAKAGRKKPGKNKVLCYLVTPKGLFLAWSEDMRGPAPKGGVNVESDERTIIRALKLKG